MRQLREHNVDFPMTVLDSNIRSAEIKLFQLTIQELTKGKQNRYMQESIDSSGKLDAVWNKSSHRHNHWVVIRNSASCNRFIRMNTQAKRRYQVMKSVQCGGVVPLGTAQKRLE